MQFNLALAYGLKAVLTPELIPETIKYGAQFSATSCSTRLSFFATMNLFKKKKKIYIYIYIYIYIPKDGLIPLRSLSQVLFCHLLRDDSTLS